LAAGNKNWRNVPIPAVLEIASNKHHIAGIVRRDIWKGRVKLEEIMGILRVKESK
jgi:hypothetical protein